jgi:predicted homoserine dehydrogenase-like protein
VLQPTHGFRTNVHAFAKRPLRRGERLDGPGGYACYGLIENCSDTPAGLPICLSDGAILLRDVGTDERIRVDQVRFPSDDAAHRSYFESVSDGARAARPGADR